MFYTEWRLRIDVKLYCSLYCKEREQGKVSCPKQVLGSGTVHTETATERFGKYVLVFPLFQTSLSVTMYEAYDAVWRLITLSNCCIN